MLKASGATLDSIVKLTVYLTDMSQLQDYARVRAEFITRKPPALTALGVASLALPTMMIEVDAIAVL